MRSIFDYYASLDSEEKFGTIMLLIFAVVIVAGKGINDDNKRKDIVDRKTTEILNKAHEHAVSTVNTINFDGTPIDVKAAQKDSVQAVKQTRKLVHKFYKANDSKKFKEEEYLDPRDHYGIIRITTNEAMSDPKFANAYGKYIKAIQQLEISRRQGKLK
ncbi:MAG: hypothetical protein IKN73_03350 [Alphaproteobacteria bacterium]|nr:hypothetical protein [Alphaproteobacteria bacterium]